ncbi:MAG: hypothetical protein AB7F31_00485 [Parachlamydiales bacterium]
MENLTLENTAKYAALTTAGICYLSLVGTIAKHLLTDAPVLSYPFAESYCLSGLASLITLPAWHLTRPKGEVDKVKMGIGLGIVALWFAGSAYSLYTARHLSGWSAIAQALVPFITVVVPVTGLGMTHWARSTH